METVVCEPTAGAAYEMSPVQDRFVGHNMESTTRVSPEEASVQELPPVDRGKKAWMFCVSAFFVEFMVWGFGFSYGVFQNYYTTHPPFEDTPSVAIAAVGTICLSLQYGEALFVSVAVCRYPDYVKPGMWFGLVLICVSVFASSFADQVWQLILLQGVGIGIGGGLLYFPIVALIPQWFVERRGLAAGLIYSGSGAGGFVFPLMLNALFERIGVQWTHRVWAIMTLVIAGIALLGINSRLPILKYTRGQRRPRLIPPRLSFFNSWLFWTFAVTTILQALSYFPVSLYLTTFASLVSSFPLSATVALSLFNTSGAASQVVMGHLCDRFPYSWIMFVSALGSGIAAFLLWGFATDVARVFAFAVIFGGLSGGFASILPTGSYDCAGNRPEQGGVAYGCILVFKGIAVIVGPIVSGILYDTGSASYALGAAARYGTFGFGPVEVFVGACAVATSVGSVVVAVVRNRVRAQ